MLDDSEIERYVKYDNSITDVYVFDFLEHHLIHIHQTKNVVNIFVVFAPKGLYVGESKKP